MDISNIIFFLMLNYENEAQLGSYSKFKDQLKVWDQFPLIHVMEFKKGNVLGANLHHTSTKSRLSAINNNRFPESTLRYYIPKNADRIFFEVKESEVELIATLPLEKFHRNR